MSMNARRGCCAWMARQNPIEQLEKRTLLATVAPKVGMSFEGIDYADVLTIPPDVAGAVGLNDVIEATNGRFRRFDRYGNVQQNISLDQFWANAGVTVVGTSFEPRVEYDPGRDRFYLCALDNAGDNNAFLFALSNSDNAADGWTGFRIDSDAGSGNRWAEFPAMGFDNDGVYITANMLDIPGGAVLSQEVNILVLPKTGLYSATPNVNLYTVLEDVSATTGDFPVPIISIDSTEASAVFPPRFVSADGNSIDFSTLGGTIAVPSIANLADVPVVAVSQYGNAAQPDGTQNLDSGGWRLSSHVYEQDQKYWIAQSIQGTTGDGAIRFAVIDTGLNLVQYQQLENSTADYLYPSIAVNEAQDVAIGFTRTGPDAGEYPSAYVIMGTTSGNTTTFGSPQQVHGGTASYHRNDGTGINRWGDYTQTVIDPKQSAAFWTFQEFAKSSSAWGTWIAKVSPSGVLPGDLSISRTTASGFAVPFGLTGESNDQLSYDAFIDSKGDVDTYFFGGDPAVGSNFTITVDDGSALVTNPCLAIYDADTGDMVAFDEDAGTGDSAMITFNGVSHHRYILAVADEQGGTGDYFVNINYGNTAPGVVIDLGQFNNADINVNIGSNVDPEFYRFTTPDDAVGSGYLMINPPGGSLDLTVWIFDAQGNRYRRDSAASPGGGVTIDFTNLQPSSTYYITMLSEDYASSGTATGSLWIEYVMGPLGLTYNGPVASQLVPSAANGVGVDSYFGNADITSSTDIDAFYIARDESSSPAEFTVQAYDANFGLQYDPVIAVYRENGTLVAWNNNDGPGFYGAEVTFTPQQGKRYIVAVCNYTGTGDVTVKWDRTTPTRTTMPLTNGGGVTGATITSNGAAYYQFTTPAFTTGTGTVAFDPSTSTPDGVLLITNTAGVPVGSARPHTPGADVVAQLTGLQSNTTYYITATSYNYETSGFGFLYVNIDLPTPPAPGQPDLSSASDTGNVNTDNITSDNTPTFTGSSFPGTTVHLYGNGVDLGSDVTNNLGVWTITTAALPQGTFPFTAKAEVGGGLSPASGALNVTIDRTAPTVPLSGLSFLTLFAVQAKFDEDVSASFAVSDFVITQAGTGNVVPNSVKAALYSPALNVASIYFPTLTNTVLPDGDYNVSINAAAMEDVAGNTLASHHAFSFFFLQADADRNRIVDTRDFNQLAGGFGGANKNFAQGNFNYDTAVDSLDFNILSLQYGKQLVAPAATPSAVSIAPAAGPFSSETEIGIDDEQAAVI